VYRVSVSTPIQIVLAGSAIKTGLEKLSRFAHWIGKTAEVYAHLIQHTKDVWRRISLLAAIGIRVLAIKQRLVPAVQVIRLDSVAVGGAAAHIARTATDELKVVGAAGGPTHGLVKVPPETCYIDGK
jgi:hypothetical protein